VQCFVLFETQGTIGANDRLDHVARALGADKRLGMDIVMRQL
jgi:hypothetical protein